MLFTLFNRLSEYCTQNHNNCKKYQIEKHREREASLSFCCKIWCDAMGIYCCKHHEQACHK